MRKQKNAKEILVAILIFAFSNNIQSQQVAGSEIYGNMSIAPEVIGLPLIDNNWGALPSMQGTNVDMWGRELNLNNNTQTYNAVDTLETGGLIGTTSADYDAAPPPDDPIDIPLDGGVTLLLTTAAILGYKYRNTLLP
ncbi:MAG: hypothetical protein AMXMBFR79_02290 [Chitinophagaceae bacterium]|nr:hypothetical protein [Chitinophagales bacterium]